MNQRQATIICAIVLTVFAVVIVMSAGRSQGWPGTGGDVHLSGTYMDYVPIWTAGRFVLDGRASDAYDWVVHGQAATELLGQNRPDYQPWPYPPTFLAVAAPFAFLPYGASMMLFVMATSAAFVAAAAKIIGSARGGLWMAVSIPALYNAQVGQNGALSAALLGFGLAFLPVRPVLAGMCLGALAYKPHIGVLIPLALAVSGNWRAFMAAAVTTIGFATVSVAMFGLDAWSGFFAQMPHVAELVLNRRPEILQSTYGLLVTMRLPAEAAMSMQVLLALLAATAVVWLWRRHDVDYSSKAAVLATASLLVSPYLFVYDLCILMVPQAFLLRSVLLGRVDQREIDGMILINALIALSPALGVPTGAPAVLLMLALLARRIISDNPEMATMLRDLTKRPA